MSLRLDTIPPDYQIEEFDLDEGYVVFGIGFSHFNKEAVEWITWGDRTYRRGSLLPLSKSDNSTYCSMRRYDLEVDHVGVHTSHCCKQHGCKYGDANCPVEFGDLDGVVCESCDHERQHEEAIEKAMHQYLNRVDPPRFDQQFPALMRLNGLVDHFNGLAKLYTTQETKLKDFEALAVTLLLSGRLDPYCIGLINDLRAKYK